MSVIDAMDRQAERKAAVSRTAVAYGWENPVTRVNATIDPHWTNSVTKNEDGQLIYMFSERADRAIVVFAVEQFAGRSLNEYVRAFQKGTAANMKLDDGGRFFERNKRPMWQSSGRMVEDSSNRVTVQVVQNGSSFWRVVTVQAMPHDYSDKMVNELQGALWGTVQ